MSSRGLSFGPIAESYEQYRPGYPDALFHVVAAYAGRPIPTALEIGAGTGKATRLFAGHGVRVTATEPDAAMLAQLRATSPRGVTAVRAALEDLQLGSTYRLVYAAASLHWTAARGRWDRVSSLLEPGGVFASFGGPFELSDPAVEDAVGAARASFMETDDVPSPDGTPPDEPLQWPGTELQRSGLFHDIRQEVVERRLRMTAHDYLGYLSTVSAYLQLPPGQRRDVFDAIAAVLPETVAITADIIVHLARRP